jgi:hypothetical protein
VTPILGIAAASVVFLFGVKQLYDYAKEKYNQITFAAAPSSAKRLSAHITDLQIKVSNDLEPPVEECKAKGQKIISDEQLLKDRKTFPPSLTSPPVTPPPHLNINSASNPDVKIKGPYDPLTAELPQNPKLILGQTLSDIEKNELYRPLSEEFKAEGQKIISDEQQLEEHNTLPSSLTSDPSSLVEVDLIEFQEVPLTPKGLQKSPAFNFNIPELAEIRGNDAGGGPGSSVFHKVSSYSDLNITITETPDSEVPGGNQSVTPTPPENGAQPLTPTSPSFT